MFQISLSLVLLIINGVLTTSTNLKRNPKVHLRGGIIEGNVLDTKPLKVNQYLGIPYAEPPIGDLRFMPTQPLKSFPRRLKAVTQPPACHQYTPIDLPFADNAPGQSEDCLYLNIWAPAEASPSNLKAVLYWIFGGGFAIGSIRLDFYNATQLAAFGDIVVVSVSSRLGALGYLSSKTEDAPGNAGLWDLLEGLKWVHRNIKPFGGDPDRVTISGESSGSILVGLLSISPLSKDLFRRQLMQSGSPTYLVFDNTTRNTMISEAISSQVGCSNETYTMKDHPKEVIGCLRKVDAAIFPRLSSETLIPQYGDEIFPNNPRQTISNGDFISKDALMGVNKNEGSIMAGDYAKEFGFNGEIQPHLNRTSGREFMRKVFNDFPDTEAVVDHYLPDTVPENALEEIERRIFQAYGDVLLTCPPLYHAEKVAEQRKYVYFYYWGHRANNSVTNPRFGVPHFEEVQFVFGIPLRKPPLYEGYDEADVRISVQAIEMWANFVKYGDPSSSWPLFSRSTPDFKFFGTKSEKRDIDFQDLLRNCDFLRPYFGF